jgi:hypothetical protein
MTAIPVWKYMNPDQPMAEANSNLIRIKSIVLYPITAIIKQFTYFNSDVSLINSNILFGLSLFPGLFPS